MGSEAARAWLAALALVLAMGCTTKVVNLAVDVGGAGGINVPSEDAASAKDADVSKDADVVKDADVAKDADVDVVKDADVVTDADVATSADFLAAFDAGKVPGPAHYVNFMCCVGVDAGNCKAEVLGGPDLCDLYGEWKSRATDFCTAQGTIFIGGYDLYGACSTDGGQP